MTCSPVHYLCAIFASVIALSGLGNPFSKLCLQQANVVVYNKNKLTTTTRKPEEQQQQQQQQQ